MIDEEKLLATISEMADELHEHFFTFSQNVIKTEVKFKEMLVDASEDQKMHSQFGYLKLLATDFAGTMLLLAGRNVLDPEEWLKTVNETFHNIHSKTKSKKKITESESLEVH